MQHTCVQGCLGYSSLFRGYRCAHKEKTFLRFFDNWGRMFLCLVGSMHASIQKPFFIQFHAFYFILFFCVKLAKCRTSSGFTPLLRETWICHFDPISTQSQVALQSIEDPRMGTKKRNRAHFSRQTKWSLRLPSIKFMRSVKFNVLKDCNFDLTSNTFLHSLLQEPRLTFRTHFFFYFLLYCILFVKYNLLHCTDQYEIELITHVFEH